jgi:hypothetical protein
MKKLTRFFAWLTLCAGIPHVAQAVNEKGEWPWNEKLHGWHDREVAEALGAGWFLNVGPTGLRARITHEHPQYLTVKYVFKKSPAHGLIQINDIIVGANGKRLTVPHTFGRGSRGRSTWDGPMVDMAKLIEDSQGKDGKLDLIVWPGGAKSAEKIVALQIPAIGRFSPTWPFDCPRSDKLMVDLCDFLADEYKRAGKFESQVQTHSAAVLALMASGDKKYDSLLRGIMSSYGSKRYDPNSPVGYPAWSYGYDGIVMAEYYRLHKDRSLLPAIESLNRCLELGQTPDSGGYSHKPFPAIQQRVAAGGPKGYGDMAMPGGLTMLAMSLLKENGLTYPVGPHERIHQSYLCSMNASGAVDYGFKDWDHAVVEPVSPKSTAKVKLEDVGYLCPDGMAGIGEYKIVWPTKTDPRYRPTDWLEKEKAKNRVYTLGGTQRLVIRDMTMAEPKKPYDHDGNACDHFGRTGVGALAHSIGGGGRESWGYVADFLATGAAKSSKGLLDGHASTHIHVLWGSLGAALAKEKDYREFMDGIKWWFIMAQAHDGGFVVMPGRDYASTDHVYGTRNFPTACAALILSVKKKHILITGASRSPEVAAADSKLIPSTQPRKIRAAALTQLGEELHQDLAELSKAQLLKPWPMTVSTSTEKMWLAAVEADGKLTFKNTSGNSSSSVEFSALSTADHALLSRLVVSLRPTNPEAQIMAAVYQEITGQQEAANQYYRNAGPTLRKICDAWFE